MNKLGLIAGALLLCGATWGVRADEQKLDEQKLDASSLAPANNAAAVAAAKADGVSGFSMGGGDVANSQLGSRGDASALGDGMSAAIGSHSYSAAPDEGSVKKGVLNAKIEATTLAADPQIGGAAKMGSDNAAHQVDAHDFMK